MTNPDHNRDEELDEGQTFISHLLELRDRLLRVVLSVLIIFLCLVYFSDDLYTIIAGPLLKLLPEGSKMIAIDVASPFLTPIKLTLVLSIFLAIPNILYQAWHFVAPGLYRHERKLALPIVASSVVLFYLGMIFAYFVIFPLMFGFFTKSAPHGVAIMTDISKYLDFVLTIFFAFGVAFEVPIATILLVWTGVTTPQKLAGMRPYIIVALFVIGMLLTPPDVISQTLLAIPMWALFELGIVFARFYVPKKDEEDGEQEAAEQSQETTAAPATQTAGQGTASQEPAADTGYSPMTDEEMDEEFDRADREMQDLSGESGDGADEAGPSAEEDPDDNKRD